MANIRKRLNRAVWTLVFVRMRQKIVVATLLQRCVWVRVWCGPG